ncbi:MAG: serine/threonine protein kinase [Deltaproteobacteria bacterium]|nr:serine/threonine protein kinase [Deltaproteobacteria bacterium]
MSTTLPAPFGKYFLLEKIATGGMAEVFKAKTFGVDGFEKIVCIKKVLSHWASDPEFIQMLIDEAKLSAALSHPNIVQVLDLGSFENAHFIAMEYVEGFDLKTLMSQVAEKKEKIPTDIACFIALQVLAGLDYAHKKTDAEGNSLHIIHRDISPHNVLLSRNGEVKITDFGIAKAAQKQSFTTTGMLRGKYSYMSPEQVRSENLNGKSDVFSLGIVLFEMLTGQKCFPGDSEIIILDKIRSSQMKLEDIPAELPSRLREILAKALAQNPQERYDAEVMQIDLAQFLATIRPGFLAKDLSDYLKPYKRPIMVSNESSSSNTQASSPSNKTLATGIAPPLGGNSGQVSVAKKSNTLVWILLILFILFFMFVGGGYAAWVFVVKPKLSPNLQNTQKSIDDMLKKLPANNPDLQKQIDDAQKAAQGLLNNPALQKQIDDAHKAANNLLNQVPNVVNNPNMPANTNAPVNPVNPTPPLPPSQPSQQTNLGLSNNGNLNPAQPTTMPSSQPIMISQTQAESQATPPVNAINPVPSNQAQALISSNPQGAKIFINDQPTGLTTPASVDKLVVNTQYKIRLEKAGYYNLEGFLTPTTTALQDVTFPLKELPAQKPKPRYREEGDFRLKQRPPPGVGGYNNSLRNGYY